MFSLLAALYFLCIRTLFTLSPALFYFFSPTFLTLLHATTCPGLASVSSPAGLRVAAEWLGALLVHLSKDVTPYTAFSVLVHQQEPQPDGAAATGYKHAVPVVPAFARAIAAELLAATDQPGAAC